MLKTQHVENQLSLFSLPCLSYPFFFSMVLPSKVTFTLRGPPAFHRYINAISTIVQRLKNVEITLK